ncbi:MAG: hypothetical protein QOD95_1789 [Gammaproteobacteria bacterium]|nr:hypothetical protein [Gammaproteobacteria bacterium]
MKLNVAVAAFTLLVPVLTRATGDRSRVYESHDHQMQAIVTGVSGESRVDIRVARGRLLFRRDERSEDGEHGHGIVHAAWTSDSQFFVASTAASGGHQPWARPMWVYSRRQNRVYELSEFDVVATTSFTLRPPDILQVTAIGCEAGTRTLRFSIHHLVSRSKAAMAPCIIQLSNYFKASEKAPNSKPISYFPLLKMQ